MAMLLPAPAAAAPCASVIPPADQRAALEDMAGSSEAVPRDQDGVPYKTEWMQRGRVAHGNKPPMRFQSIMPWLLIINSPDNRVPEAKVELRRTSLLVLSRRTGTWTSLIDSKDYAGHYFSKRVGRNEKIARLPIAASGATAAVTVDQRYVAHFWPVRSRRGIDPVDIGGVFVTVEARIDRKAFQAGARYLMDVAADYWADGNAKWDNYRTNGDAGIGRLKLLQPTWRKFYMTTADAASLAACVVPGAPAGEDTP